jgi:hypothetical protein
MSRVKAVLPNYAKGDAHIIRRLGGAVVAQWSNLPTDLKQLILSQATLVHDAHQTVQLEQQIEHFIEQNQGWPDSGKIGSKPKKVPRPRVKRSKPGATAAVKSK